MEPETMMSLTGTEAPTFPGDRHGEIVEIALLLPKNRAEALLALSARRHQSVGQIIRGLIDRALGDSE
jgi:hypothetical protein